MVTRTIPVYCAITYRSFVKIARRSVTLLRCYSSREGYSKPKISSIFIYIIIYINIGITLDFRTIVFGTVTLQHCNTLCAILPNCTFY